MNDVPGFEAKLIALFDRPELFWVALAVAVAVGAFHAVAPGHGKSITAAYLAGSRGRYRDAAFLGGVVAAMHTVSVLVLAVAWVGLSAVSSRGTETFTAWMQIVAGGIVIGVGASMLLRARRHGHSHGSDHSHSHGHSHGHRHDHHGHHEHGGPSRPGIVVLGLSGGLLPSPSAFLVLVTGLLTGRALDAVILVAAFGLGMAATLTAVGIATILGTAALDVGAGRWAPLRQLVAWTPHVAGVAVLGGGSLYVVRAVSALGL